MMMYVSSYEDIYHVVLLKLSDGGILRRGFICMVVFYHLLHPDWSRFVYDMMA
jgi:hypothetical protein